MLSLSLKVEMVSCIAVDLDNLKPPVLEGLDALIAVCMLFLFAFILRSINFLLGMFLLVYVIHLEEEA